jgi:hypothetical protein
LSRERHQGKKRLRVISRDGDHGTVFDDKGFLNRFPSGEHGYDPAYYQQRRLPPPLLEVMSGTIVPVVVPPNDPPKRSGEEKG